MTDKEEGHGPNLERQCDDKKYARRRQKRSKTNTLVDEYNGMSFHHIKSTGLPGTPHSFFESSYGMSFEDKTAMKHGEKELEDQTREKEQNDDSKEDVLEKRNVNSECHDLNNQPYQVIHRHANGLCIVTAGSLIQKAVRGGEKSIVKIDFRKLAPEPQTLGGKRKKKAKLMRKNQTCVSPGLARPSDSLVVVTLDDGETIDLKCCVYGTILELNDKLQYSLNDEENDTENEKKREGDNQPMQSLLVSDPLLDGYLAVIMPSGAFPLSTNISEN